MDLHESLLGTNIFFYIAKVIYYDLLRFAGLKVRYGQPILGLTRDHLYRPLGLPFCGRLSSYVMIQRLSE